MTKKRSPHFCPALSRRDFLLRAGAGFGGMALSVMMAQDAQAAAAIKGAPNPLAPHPPMFPAKAKSVIFLFMYGGVSHVDTFDPKPELTRHDGLPLTGKGEIKTFFGGAGNLMKSPFTFAKYGQCGMDVSELFPHVAQRVDDLCFVRSLYGDSNNHAPALFEMNTGVIQQGKPALGSWVTYG
ncbi:MAG: DUF1501 domain-containing protein, partial [Armatimonadota bacterium]|nr:DUF1501 domain-containing protein [Armatimonadota bacterium]